MYPSPTQRRRASLKELYSMKGGHRSSPQLSRGNGSAATIRNPARASKIKRWDGKRRTTTVWDSLRHVSWVQQCLHACMMPIQWSSSLTDLFSFSLGSGTVGSWWWLPSPSIWSWTVETRCFIETFSVRYQGQQVQALPEAPPSSSGSRHLNICRPSRFDWRRISAHRLTSCKIWNSCACSVSS